MNYEQTKELLKRNGQEQLLRFWDELDETGKEKLLRNIERLDFAVLENLKHPQNLSGEGSRLSPVKGLSVADIEANEQRFKTIGNEALKSGKIAGLLLAGGQGTRLGAEGPKGAFNMGVTRELSIFACQMNNLLNDLRESGARPLLLVMTSEKNDEETQEFWKENGYFGYDAEKVRFFVQDAAPCTDMNGKILQEEKDTPATSPNGNGGWFSSLKKSGLYEELKNGGAEWLNVYAVDNVLQRPFDPVFIGATLESGKACGAKCVRKNSPQEKVGVLCEKDGKAAVIEYYELTEETEREKIPVHIVKKKIPYVNERGEKCEPQRENGLKFETLAVDLISFMGSVLPCEVRREKEFAPVKNATGADSVETARALLELNGVTL